MLNPNLNNGGTFTTNKAALVAGTTTTYTTTVAFDYMIDAKWGTQFATKTNQATPTTDYRTSAAFNALAASKGCVLVFATTSGGVVKMLQGEIESIDESGEFVVAPHFPSIPVDVAPFGYVVCVNDSTGSAWTPGTTNWASVTGFTATFVDIGMMPSRPQES